MDDKVVRAGAREPENELRRSTYHRVSQGEGTREHDELSCAFAFTTLSMAVAGSTSNHLGSISGHFWRVYHNEADRCRPHGSETPIEPPQT